MKQMSQIKTIEQSISANTPIIGQVQKSYGHEKTVAFLSLWILDLNKFLNVNRGLEQVHIEQICEFIIQDYRNISMSDINIIFTKAKKGGYGQFYENLSMPKILSWFEEYQNERSNLYGEISRRNALNISGNTNRSESVFTLLGTRLEAKLNNDLKDKESFIVNKSKNI